MAESHKKIPPKDDINDSEFKEEPISPPQEEVERSAPEFEEKFDNPAFPDDVQRSESVSQSRKNVEDEKRKEKFKKDLEDAEKQLKFFMSQIKNFEKILEKLSQNSGALNKDQKTQLIIYLKKFYDPSIFPVLNREHKIELDKVRSILDQLESPPRNAVPDKGISKNCELAFTEIMTGVLLTNGAVDYSYIEALEKKDLGAAWNSKKREICKLWQAKLHMVEQLQINMKEIEGNKTTPFLELYREAKLFSELVAVSDYKAGGTLLALMNMAVAINKLDKTSDKYKSSVEVLKRLSRQPRADALIRKELKEFNLSEQKNAELVEFNLQKKNYMMIIIKMKKYSDQDKMALKSNQYEELVNHLRYLKSLCSERDLQTKLVIEQYLQDLEPFQLKYNTNNKNTQYASRKAQVAFAVIATGASLAQGNCNLSFIEKLKLDAGKDKRLKKMSESIISTRKMNVLRRKADQKSHSDVTQEKNQVDNLSLFDADKLEKISRKAMHDSKDYYIGTKQGEKPTKKAVMVPLYRQQLIPDVRYVEDLLFSLMESFGQYKTTEARLLFVKKMIETMKACIENGDYSTFTAFLEALKKINSAFDVRSMCSEHSMADYLPDLVYFEKYLKTKPASIDTLYKEQLKEKKLTDEEHKNLSNRMYIPSPLAMKTLIDNIKDTQTDMKILKDSVEEKKLEISASDLQERIDRKKAHIANMQSFFEMYRQDYHESELDADITDKLSKTRAQYESDGYRYDDVDNLYRADVFRRLNPEALKYRYVVSTEDIENARIKHEAKEEAEAKSKAIREEQKELKSSLFSRLELVRHEHFPDYKVMQRELVEPFHEMKTMNSSIINTRMALLKEANFSHILIDSEGKKVYVQYHEANANYDSMNPINPYEAEIQALQYLKGILIIADHDPKVTVEDIKKIYKEFEKHVPVGGPVAVEHTEWLAEQFAQLLSVRLGIDKDIARRQVTMARDMAVMSVEPPSVCTITETGESKVSIELAQNGHVSEDYYNNHFTEEWLRGAEKFAGFEGSQSNWVAKVFDKEGEQFKKFKEHGVPAPPSARWLELPGNWQHLKHFQAEVKEGKLQNTSSSDFIRLGTLSAYYIDKEKQRKLAVDQLKEVIKQQLIQQIQDYKRSYEGLMKTPPTIFVDYINILSPVKSDTTKLGEKMVKENNNNDFILLAKLAMRDAEAEVKKENPAITIVFNHTNSAINHLADRSKGENLGKKVKGIASLGVREFVSDKNHINTKLEAVADLVDNIAKVNLDLKWEFDLITLTKFLREDCTVNDIKFDGKKVEELASRIESGEKIGLFLANKSADVRFDIANRLRAAYQLKLLMSGQEPYASMRNSERNLMKSCFEILAQGKQAIKIVGCKSARDRTAILMAAVKTMQEDPATMNDFVKLNDGIIRGLKQGHHFRAMCYHVAIVKVADVRKYFQDALPKLKSDIQKLKVFVTKLDEHSSKLKPSSTVAAIKNENVENKIIVIIKSLADSADPADRRLAELVAMHSDKLKTNEIDALINYTQGKNVNKEINTLSQDLRKYSNQLALEQISELKNAIENLNNGPIIDKLKVKVKELEEKLDLIVTDKKVLDEIKELINQTKDLHYPPVKKDITANHRQLLLSFEYRQAILEKRPVQRSEETRSVELTVKDINLKKSNELLGNTFIDKSIDDKFKEDILTQLDHLLEIRDKYQNDALFYKLIQEKYKNENLFIEDLVSKCNNILSELESRNKNFPVDINNIKKIITDEINTLRSPMQRPKILQKPDWLEKRKAKAELEIELAMIELRQAMIESRVARNTAQIHVDAIQANKYISKETKEKYNALYKKYRDKKIDNFSVNKMASLIGNYQVVKEEFKRDKNGRVITTDMKVENSAQSDERVLKILGQNGYDILHEGTIPPDPDGPTEARKLYLHELQRALDERRKNGNHTTPTSMHDLLGAKGIELYKAAMKEEAASKAFRNAVFLRSVKTHYGPKWLKRLVLWVGGPSASGKTFATDGMIGKIAHLMDSDKKGEDIENHIVTIDGAIEREVSQIRQLTVQTALVLGNTGIDDLEDFSKAKLKDKIQNAADKSSEDSEHRLHMVIPETFTKFIGKSDQIGETFEKYNNPETMHVFSQVTCDDEAKETFQESVRRMGTSRAYLKEGTVYSGISINNFNIGCESKKYDPGFFLFPVFSKKHGIKFIPVNFQFGKSQTRKSLKAHESALDLSKAKEKLTHQDVSGEPVPASLLDTHQFEIINDLIYIIYDVKKEEWRPCKEDDEGQVIMTTQRAFKAWKVDEKKYLSKGDDPYDTITEWLATKGDKPEYKDPLIQYYLNGKPVALKDEQKPEIEVKEPEAEVLIDNISVANADFKTLIESYVKLTSKLEDKSVTLKPEDKKSLETTLANIQKRANELFKANNAIPGEENYQLIYWQDQEKTIYPAMVRDNFFVGGEGMLRFGYKINDRGGIEGAKIAIKSMHQYLNNEEYQAKVLDEISASKVLDSSTSDMIYFANGTVGYYMDHLPGHDFGKKWENTYRSVYIYTGEEKDLDPSVMKIDQIILSSSKIYWLEDGKIKSFSYSTTNIKNVYDKYVAEGVLEVKSSDSADLINMLKIKAGCRYGEGLNWTEVTISDLTVKQRCEILLDLFEQLALFHEKGYCHCDLNPTNIRIYRDEEGNIRGKIFDFGQALQLTPANLDSEGLFNLEDRMVGMLEFLAPESSGNNRKYGKPSDQYGMGALIGMMFTENPNDFIRSKIFIGDSLNTADKEEQTKLVSMVPYDYERMFERLELENEQVKEKIINFTRRMTDRDPAKRPTTTEALEFFSRLIAEENLEKSKRPQSHPAVVEEGIELKQADLAIFDHALPIATESKEDKSREMAQSTEVDELTRMTNNAVPHSTEISEAVEGMRHILMLSPLRADFTDAISDLDGRQTFDKRGEFVKEYQVMFPPGAEGYATQIIDSMIKKAIQFVYFDEKFSPAIQSFLEDKVNIIIDDKKIEATRLEAAIEFYGFDVVRDKLIGAACQCYAGLLLTDQSDNATIMMSFVRRIITNQLTMLTHLHTSIKAIKGNKDPPFDQLYKEAETYCKGFLEQFNIRVDLSTITPLMKMAAAINSLEKNSASYKSGIELLNKLARQPRDLNLIEKVSYNFIKKVEAGNKQDLLQYTEAEIQSINGYSPSKINIITISDVEKYLEDNPNIRENFKIALLKNYKNENEKEALALENYNKEKQKNKKLKPPKDTRGERLLKLIYNIAEIEGRASKDIKPPVLAYFNNAYIHVGEKKGGANKPGPHGGLYKKVADKSKYLFKQDTSYKHLKIIPKLEPLHNVEKDISEFVATKMSSGIYKDAAPEMEVKIHPDQDSPYIGSRFVGAGEGERYEDLFKDVFSQYYRMPQLKLLRDAIHDGTLKQKIEQYQNDKDKNHTPKYVDPEYFTLLDNLKEIEDKDEALSILNKHIKSHKKMIKNRPMFLGTKQTLNTETGRIFRDALARKEDENNVDSPLIYKGIEKCLVLSALFADNDVHSGNIGVVVTNKDGVESRQCVRIDFGAALAKDYFNTHRALKLGSAQRAQFLIAAPTNHFSEYPRSVRYTEAFANAIEEGVQALQSNMEKHLNLFTSDEFKLWPTEDRLKFAEYIGIEAQDLKSFTNEELLNKGIKDRVEKVLIYRMDLLKQYELDIRLSLCLEKDEKGDLKFNTKKLESLIEENKKDFEDYFHQGKYKLRTGLFQESPPRALHDEFRMHVKNIYANLSKQENLAIEMPSLERKHSDAVVREPPAKEKTITERTITEKTVEELAAEAATRKTEAERADEEKKRITQAKIIEEELAKAAVIKASEDKAREAAEDKAKVAAEAKGVGAKEAEEKEAKEKEAAEATRLKSAIKAEEHKEEKEEKKVCVAKVTSDSTKVIGQLIDHDIKEHDIKDHEPPKATTASSSYVPGIKPQNLEVGHEVNVPKTKFSPGSLLSGSFVYSATFTKKLEADNSLSIICPEKGVPKPPYLDDQGMPTWQCLQYVKDQIREIKKAFAPKTPIIEVYDPRFLEAYVLICKANGITCKNESRKPLSSSYEMNADHKLHKKLALDKEPMDLLLDKINKEIASIESDIASGKNKGSISRLAQLDSQLNKMLKPKISEDHRTKIQGMINRIQDFKDKDDTEGDVSQRSISSGTSQGWRYK